LCHGVVLFPFLGSLISTFLMQQETCSGSGWDCRCTRATPRSARQTPLSSRYHPGMLHRVETETETPKPEGAGTGGGAARIWPRLSYVCHIPSCYPTRATPRSARRMLLSSRYFLSSRRTCGVGPHGVWWLASERRGNNWNGFEDSCDSRYPSLRQTPLSSR